MQRKQPDLSIIVPAYCEERRIGRSLDELARFLRDDSFFKHKSVEVLVVAADAPDRTHEIAEDKLRLFQNAQLLKPGSRVGKGRDVQYGMRRARGKLAIFMDADLATPLHHLREFYDACHGGSDIVIGTRNLLTYRPNMFHNACSYVGNILLYKLIGGLRVNDTQCGFKMFSEHARNMCFSKMTIQGWDFDAELLTIAKVKHLRVRALLIPDWQDVPYGTHTSNVLLIALRATASLGRVLYNRLRGVYTDC